jgi:type IV pilus assembly protein PilC
MPAFAWKGKNNLGDPQEGIIVADSKSAAGSLLQRNGITVTSIQAQAAKTWGRLGKVKPKTLAIFTRQFSVMIDAGLPLVQCLEILAEQQDDKNFKSVINEVRLDVEQGATLQAAMAKHPKTFNDLYVNMVGAGETGGILDTILQRLSGYIEKTVKLAGKVRSAMAYPAIVLMIAAIVVYVIMVKVIPVFTEVYEGLGSSLPVPTLICIKASNVLVHYSYIVLAAIIVLVLLYRQYYKTASGKLRIDSMYLKLPIFGDIIRKVTIARFCRTLGTLVSSGVPILEGMDITAKTAGNQVVQNAILKCRDSVEQGRTIAAPLAETKVFPPMVVQMVGVGETTGALDAMLAKVADFYDDEVDNAVAALTALMEPMMIVILAVIIGFIVISMYMPIFMLGEAFGG